MVGASAGRVPLAMVLTWAVSFPSLPCFRLARRSQARRLQGLDANGTSSSIAYGNFNAGEPRRGYLVTDNTIWKHSTSIDVRKMFFNDAGGAAAALKITRVPSCGDGDDACVIPEPSDFAGDRTMHEISMFEYLQTHVPSAAPHLVLFHGGGEVKLEFKDGEVVSLEFWSDGHVVYKSKCDDGTSPSFGFSKAHCKDFQAWIKKTSTRDGDEIKKTGDRILWLLTAYNPSSITILEYLQNLLKVETVEGFSSDQLRDRKIKEIANAIQACQTMLRKLYADSGFVHADYHLKNMLVALPRDSILLGAARPDVAPSIPAALLFDLDFSGFVNAATREKGHVQTTLIEDGPLVLNIPMLHALPVLDLSTKASEHLRDLLNEQGLISHRSMQEDPDAATGELLHKSDMWLGMMQLHEFSTGCDETPLARQLVGLAHTSRNKRHRQLAQAQDDMFHMMVKPNWPARGNIKDTLEKLYQLDQEFEKSKERKAELGEAPERHWHEFKNAWFRVKMLVKGFAVEQWRLGA